MSTRPSKLEHSNQEARVLFVDLVKAQVDEEGMWQDAIVLYAIAWAEIAAKHQEH
jgi:hypothetical protein